MLPTPLPACIHRLLMLLYISASPQMVTDYSRATSSTIDEVVEVSATSLSESLPTAESGENAPTAIIMHVLTTPTTTTLTTQVITPSSRVTTPTTQIDTPTSKQTTPTIQVTTPRIRDTQTTPTVSVTTPTSASSSAETTELLPFCEGVDNDLAADPNDCTVFAFCYDDGTGVKTECKCNEMFNPDALECQTCDVEVCSSCKVCE